VNLFIFTSHYLCFDYRRTGTDLQEKRQNRTRVNSPRLCVIRLDQPFVPPGIPNGKKNFREISTEMKDVRGKPKERTGWFITTVGSFLWRLQDCQQIMEPERQAEQAIRCFSSDIIPTRKLKACSKHFCFGDMISICSI